MANFTKVPLQPFDEETREIKGIEIGVDFDENATKKDEKSEQKSGYNSRYGNAVSRNIAADLDMDRTDSKWLKNINKNTYLIVPKGIRGDVLDENGGWIGTENQLKDCTWDAEKFEKYNKNGRWNEAEQMKFSDYLNEKNCSVAKLSNADFDTLKDAVKARDTAVSNGKGNDVLKMQNAQNPDCYEYYEAIAEANISKKYTDNGLPVPDEISADALKLETLNLINTENEKREKTAELDGQTRGVGAETLNGLSGINDAAATGDENAKTAALGKFITFVDKYTQGGFTKFLAEHGFSLDKKLDSETNNPTEKTSEEVLAGPETGWLDKETLDKMVALQGDYGNGEERVEKMTAELEEKYKEAYGIDKDLSDDQKNLISGVQKNIQTEISEASTTSNSAKKDIDYTARFADVLKEVPENPVTQPEKDNFSVGS